MFNLKPIALVSGTVICAVGFLLFLPLITEVIYKTESWQSYAVPILIYLIVGGSLVITNKNVDLVAAAKLARKKSIGPFRKKELNDKTKNKELGILSRAGFSYNIVKQVLFESDIEELEELYDQR